MRHRSYRFCCVGANSCKSASDLRRFSSGYSTKEKDRARRSFSFGERRGFKTQASLCSALLCAFCLDEVIFVLAAQSRLTPTFTHEKKTPEGIFFSCEETHKRFVSVGKNAKKVRKLFQNFAKYELRIYRYFEIFIISIVNKN